MALPNNIDSSELPVGTTLERWYRGRLFRVQVVEPTSSSPEAVHRGWWRYTFGGRRYKSLSAIAYAITGDRYRSGNRFFGLRRRKRGPRRRK